MNVWKYEDNVNAISQEAIPDGFDAVILLEDTHEAASIPPLGKRLFSLSTMKTQDGTAVEINYVNRRIKVGDIRYRFHTLKGIKEKLIGFFAHIVNGPIAIFITDNQQQLSDLLKKKEKIPPFKFNGGWNDLQKSLILGILMELGEHGCTVDDIMIPADYAFAIRMGTFVWKTLVATISQELKSFFWDGRPVVMMCLLIYLADTKLDIGLGYSLKDENAKNTKDIVVAANAMKKGKENAIKLWDIWKDQEDSRNPVNNHADVLLLYTQALQKAQIQLNAQTLFLFDVIRWFVSGCDIGKETGILYSVEIAMAASSYANLNTFLDFSLPTASICETFLATSLSHIKEQAERPKSEQSILEIMSGNQQEQNAVLVDVRNTLTHLANSLI